MTAATLVLDELFVYEGESVGNVDARVSILVVSGVGAGVRLGVGNSLVDDTYTVGTIEDGSDGAAVDGFVSGALEGESESMGTLLSIFVGSKDELEAKVCELLGMFDVALEDVGEFVGIVGDALGKIDGNCVVDDDGDCDGDVAIPEIDEGPTDGAQDKCVVCELGSCEGCSVGRLNGNNDDGTDGAKLGRLVGSIDEA